MEQEELDRFVQVFGDSSSWAIEQYAEWYVVSSIVWLLLAVSIIVLAIKVNWPDDWDVHPLVIKSALVGVSIIVIGCNLPDLISPNGIALHQIISDVAG